MQPVILLPIQKGFHFGMISALLIRAVEKPFICNLFEIRQRFRKVLKNLVDFLKKIKRK